MSVCEYCKGPLPERKKKHGKANGPKIRYCSNVCRAYASRLRKKI